MFCNRARNAVQDLRSSKVWYVPIESTYTRLPISPSLLLSFYSTVSEIWRSTYWLKIAYVTTPLSFGAPHPYAPIASPKCGNISQVSLKETIVKGPSSSEDCIESLADSGDMRPHTLLTGLDAFL